MADPDEFHQTLDRALLDGALRLVLVLDQAPQELVRLVGYLETVTHGLIIDLVTVTSYDIAGRRIVVPQRIEPEKAERAERSTSELTPLSSTASVSSLSSGIEAFRERLATVPAHYRATADALAAWGARIADAGLADVQTYYGKRGEVVLLPRLRPDGVGLVSLYLWPDGKPAVQWWNSVFERRAPHSIDAVAAAGGGPIGRGTMAPNVTDDLLEALYQAYVEASMTAVNAIPGPFDWSILHELLTVLPAGRWTTYGELAESSGPLRCRSAAI